MIHLLPTHVEGDIRAFKHILDPHKAEIVPKQQTHPGSEWIYVLSGRVRLLLGDEEFLLQPGQAAQFDTTIPHAVENALRVQQSEFIGLFSAAGESLHVPSFRRK